MEVRDRLLHAVVLFGLALLVITEGLSACTALTRGPLLVAWLLSMAAALSVPAARRAFRVKLPAFTFDPVVVLCALGIIAILTLTGVTAAFSPPNSSDAMAYHMPRIIYWAEQHSVRFFPTPYLNQIMLQPLAEYLMLHTYLLSGGDRFINFVQWFSSIGCLMGASAIAGCLGARKRGQWIAALFCATLPSGILASSGAKNDYFMAMWLVTAVYFAFQFAKSVKWLDAAFLGVACGLAFYTKATAYLFAPCVIAAILLPAIKKMRWRMIGPALAAGSIAFALNAPQYLRNYELSGSIMGFDSAQGDGVYRWRNDSPGWKPTVSNILRHTSEQMGGRSERWNQLVFRVVTRAHEALGIDVNDPAATWPMTLYRAPRNANHETDAPNRTALLALTVLGIAILWKARGSEKCWYALSLVAAFVAYSAYLKWQLFMGRLLLPLFVLGAPLASMLEEVLTPTLLQLAACLLLLDGARLPTLENWVRPLRGPGSVLQVARDQQYVSDMKPWDNAASYRDTAQQSALAKCDTVALDITHFQLEYPLMALLRKRNPNVAFIHAAVENASKRYAQPITATPCAVVCLECAGDEKHLSRYSDFPVRTTAGKFVTLTR